MPNPAKNVALVGSSKRQRPRVQIPSGAPPARKQLSSTSVRFHLHNPVLPGGHLGHPVQNVFLGLLAVHPTRIHRRLHQILKLPLKRQQLSVEICAVMLVTPELSRNSTLTSSS